MGVTVNARASRCFPLMKPPAAVQTTLADVLQTDLADVGFGLKLKQIFSSSAGADLVKTN